jgi:hypothetical protein
MRWWLLALAAGQDPCGHFEDENVVKPTGVLEDGQVIYREIEFNQTHLYYYQNYSTDNMDVSDKHRKLILFLEPCNGVVYLFVRKTRPCYPNPYSCIDLTDGEQKRTTNCDWTHFMSEIDGSLDGAPTYYEVPMSATKYYIAVFASEKSTYRLTVLADVGAMPRPGRRGKLEARQLDELEVQLTWQEAEFSGAAVSEVKKYHVYSTMLLNTDNRSNANVFFRPDKILNTVCGLHNNTDRSVKTVLPEECVDGTCTANIRGVLTQKRYALNVIAESSRDFSMAYGGLVIQTNWLVVTKAADDATLKAIGAVGGCTLGAVIIGYINLLRFYN